MEVDAFSGKGKGERKGRQERERWQEGKKTTQVEITASKTKRNRRTSNVSVETVESTDTGLLTAGMSSRSLRAKATGMRNPK